MKRPIVLVFAGVIAAVTAAEAKVLSDTVKTPLGLEIKLVGVHDLLNRDACKTEAHSKIYWSCEGVPFSHGNMTVRMLVDNPTAVPQPLRVEFPIRIGYRYDLPVHSHFPQCVVTRMIPPGKGRSVDFAVPHVGLMHNDFRNLGSWLFTDASGKSVNGKEMGRSCEAQEFVMPQKDCGNKMRFVVAASSSFRDAPDLVRGVEDHEKRKGESYGRYDLDVRAPDFTRMHDWRDLACYDSLVFATNDWNACSDEFRACVKDYQAAGGRLVFADRARDVAIADFVKGMAEVNRHLRGYGDALVYESDSKAVAAVLELKDKTPFRSIMLVLLAFVIVAGPVTIFILAKRGKRIHLLWVFPSVAIVFSVAVALTIVFSNGLDVKIRVFSSEEERPDIQRKVVVTNRIFVAPFPMADAIVCSKSALVTVDSGTDQTAGDYIISTPEELQLVGNWTPCLWPVRVREVEVIRTGKEAAK